MKNPRNSAKALNVTKEQFIYDSDIFNFWVSFQKYRNIQKCILWINTAKGIQLFSQSLNKVTFNPLSRNQMMAFHHVLNLHEVIQTFLLPCWHFFIFPWLGVSWTLNIVSVLSTKIECFKSMCMDFKANRGSHGQIKDQLRISRDKWIIMDWEMH